jgi:hypothetical protein
MSTLTIRTAGISDVVAVASASAHAAAGRVSVSDVSAQLRQRRISSSVSGRRARLERGGRCRSRVGSDEESPLRLAKRKRSLSADRRRCWVATDGAVPSQVLESRKLLAAGGLMASRLERRRLAAQRSKAAKRSTKRRTDWSLNEGSAFNSAATMSIAASRADVGCSTVGIPSRSWPGPGVLAHRRGHYWS